MLIPNVYLFKKKKYANTDIQANRYKRLAVVA